MKIPLHDAPLAGGCVALGMPTLLECPQIEDCVALCVELGLHFVELNMNLPAYQAGSVPEGRIAAARDKHGIYCTLHLDENLAPCDFNPRVAEAYRQTARDAILLARRHGMPIVNMHLHPGIYFTLPDRREYLFARYRPAYLEGLRVFQGLCEDAAAGSGVRVCVENTDGFAEYAQEGLELLLRSEVFALTLDIGHAHCANGVDTAFFRKHEGRLRHMHIHDASGSACHLPFGTGQLDLAGAFQLARQRDCRAVLEVKNLAGLRQSIAYVKETD